MDALPETIVRAWPDDGCSRVPNWVYTDPDIFARELDRIFGASDWLYVCLEAEIPNPGDFKRSQLGNRDVVAVRGSDGEICLGHNNDEFLAPPSRDEIDAADTVYRSGGEFFQHIIPCSVPVRVIHLFEVIDIKH